MLALLVGAAALLRPVTRTGSVSPRGRCAVCEMPTDVWELSARAQAALQSAIIGEGCRSIRVEARVPELSPEDVEYEEEAFVLFALRCLRALTILDGPLLMLVPNMEMLVTAERALADDWAAADRDRVRVCLLEHVGEPDQMPRPAGVLVAGFNSASSEGPSHRHACAWLRSASSVAVCVNSRVRLLPFELSRYETIFAYVPYAITRELFRFPGAGRYVAAPPQARSLHGFLPLLSVAVLCCPLPSARICASPLP